MATLYSENTLQQFWKIVAPIEDELWEEASKQAMRQLGFPCESHDEMLQWSLGECSYGNNSWQLPFHKQVYYYLKPIIPQYLSKQLRRILCAGKKTTDHSWLHWPIDGRYMEYLQKTLANVMELSGKTELEMVNFWPERKQTALVLTHDVETEFGQLHVEDIANVDEKFGFHSAFFFVSQKYRPDFKLIQSLTDRGFEVGVHGFNHDGKLLCMHSCPMKRIEMINQFAEEIGAQSFRSPLTLRNPERMQYLAMPYDLSFFDTDPFEPMPGGTMSEFPFRMGRLLELPYTLPQDYTLFELLQETSPKIWEKKVEYLQGVHGMILMNTHPDYLMRRGNLGVYKEFLDGMQKKQDIYQALPFEVGAWWQERSTMSASKPSGRATITKVIREPHQNSITLVL